jgi:uncharacterized protein (TIGR03435 family)
MESIVVRGKDEFVLKKTTCASLLMASFFAITARYSVGQATQPENSGKSASSAGASNAEFEVASVKQSDSKQQIINALLTYPGGRIEARGATLKYLLMEAYNLQSYQITGGPGWINQTRFEIEAKPPADVASRFTEVPNPKNPPPDEVRQMLRNLLTERFQVKVHFEQTEGQTYELVRGSGPLRLNPPKDTNEYPWAGSVEGGLPGGDGLRGTNIPMSNLASRMSSWFSTPVVDHTGLSGSYDFEVKLDSGEDASNFEVQNNILESVKQLGLQLKKSKGLIPRLVIDEASLPTEN